MQRDNIITATANFKKENSKKGMAIASNIVTSTKADYNKKA